MLAAAVDASFIHNLQLHICTPIIATNHHYLAWRWTHYLVLQAPCASY